MHTHISPLHSLFNSLVSPQLKHSIKEKADTKEKSAKIPVINFARRKKPTAYICTNSFSEFPRKTKSALQHYSIHAVALGLRVYAKKRRIQRGTPIKTSIIRERIALTIQLRYLYIYWKKGANAMRVFVRQGVIVWA